MCVVSMVGDHYYDKWRESPWQEQARRAQRTTPLQAASAADVMALRKEVEEMKELLKKAVEYDRRTDQAHCENEQKIAFLRDFAESLGVNLDEVFK